VGIGLSRAPAAPAVGSVHFDDGDLVAQEVTGESRPIAAGPFDADELEGPEALEPDQQLLVARSGGGKALHAELSSSFVEGGRHVHVEVGVDPPLIRRASRVGGANPGPRSVDDSCATFSGARDRSQDRPTII
jgi:hypothetical protein